MKIYRFSLGHYLAAKGNNHDISNLQWERYQILKSVGKVGRHNL